MAWPSTLSNFGSSVSIGDIVQPGHVNDVRTEFIALQKSVAKGDSGTVNPGIINDAVAPANYDTTILVNGIYRIGGVLDVVASQVKRITGKSTYKIAPDTDIAKLFLATFLTYSDENALRGLIHTRGIWDMFKSGAEASKPANPFSGGGICFMYYATDKNILYMATDLVGGWAKVGFYPNGTIQADSILVHNGTRWVTMNPPATGSVFLQHTPSGWTFTGFPANFQVLQSPCIYDPDTRGLLFYTTIQQCLDNAASNKTILIPPGTYYEKLAVDASKNLVITEVIKDSVTVVYSDYGADPDGTVNITGSGQPVLNFYRVFRLDDSGVRTAQMVGVNINGPAITAVLKIKEVHVSHTSGAVQVHGIKINTNTTVSIDDCYIDTYSVGQPTEINCIKRHFSYTASTRIRNCTLRTYCSDITPIATLIYSNCPSPMFIDSCSIDRFDCALGTIKNLIRMSHASSKLILNNFTLYSLYDVQYDSTWIYNAGTLISPAYLVLE